MKKILAFILSVAFAFPAFADEGMWMLPLLQKMNSKALSQAGCRLTPEQIYSINSSSLKDAVVHFGGGCTGEVISDRGLVVTNHHCGYSYIQALSTPEHNYLEDGYWAMKQTEELPAEGLTVTFLKSMTDVTDILAKAYDAAFKISNGSQESAQEAKASAISSLEEAAKADNPNSDAEVVSFYNDNCYYLIITKTYRDVRFVGAPPVSSGKFGGDTDNWMWPRHTCDFSMFRIYAGRDNEPADYSEDNVPYVPVQALKVSLRGVQDGDFAMVMGYPGRTQRFQTAGQLQEMLDVNDVRVNARTVRQDIMWRAMRSDDVVGLQYASKYAGSSNYWKKWQGEKLAFSKLGIMQQESAKEASFKQWAAAKKSRQEAYGSAIDSIDRCVAGYAEAEKAYALMSETINRIELTAFARALLTTAREGIQAGLDTASAIAAAKDALAPSYQDYSEPLDREEAVALINYYRETALPEDMLELENWDFRTMDAGEYVDWLFTGSSFSSQERMRGIKSMDEIMADPAIRLSVALSKAAVQRYVDYQAGMAGLQAPQKAYTAGLLEWRKGEPSYPDANSTMRLTYGHVKSYSPKDGVIYQHYTTLKGVMEKEDPANYEFRVPAKLKELYNAKDFGRYADRDGTLHACFLTNCDITGGNSGSPVLDADGALVGLAFDGNWESMSSDVLFDPDLQRCICVDIRYVLFMMDKFGGAGYLLKEMNLVK